MEDDCFLLDVLAETELINLFFPPESFSFFFLFSRGHLESMSQVLKEDCSIAFTSALTIFLTASSQESSFQPQALNWAQTEGFRHSRKYRIMIPSFKVAKGSNSRKTASRCSRWATQSRTLFSKWWESLLFFLH